MCLYSLSRLTLMCFFYELYNVQSCFKLHVIIIVYISNSHNRLMILQKKKFQPIFSVSVHMLHTFSTVSSCMLCCVVHATTIDLLPSNYHALFCCAQSHIHCSRTRLNGVNPLQTTAVHGPSSTHPPACWTVSHYQFVINMTLYLELLCFSFVYEMTLYLESLCFSFVYEMTLYLAIIIVKGHSFY